MASELTTPKMELEKIVEHHGQAHVLQFWDTLDESQQHSLTEQIASFDFEQLNRLATEKASGEKWADLAARAELPPAITLAQFRDPEKHAAAKEVGGRALAAGKVAMILVAGGQGSRLGFDHPKGMFPIGPISQRPLYQIIMENVLARARQFESTIPMYVMTSPPTHAESTEFLEANDLFGFDRGNFRIFCQGVMPAVDLDGKLLLEEPGKIFASPDGHGGTVDALEKSGCLEDMRRRGIEYVFYGQVDNPLIQVCDPALIGFHILHQSQMTTQVVRKQEPLQKVGNVVSVDGKVQIIEYSDLPEQYATQLNDDKSLTLWAGSIAVHIFDSTFLYRASKSASMLPFHHANKKVAYIDSNGQKVQPTENNAVKFEKFIFDLLPLAENAIVCEVDPAEGFCAVKNAPPAPSETPEHVRDAIVALHTRWLRDAGVSVAEGVPVEINPSFAVDAAEVKTKADKIDEITTPTYFQ